jgi:hypothetical protein
LASFVMQKFQRNHTKKSYETIQFHKKNSENRKKILHSKGGLN